MDKEQDAREYLIQTQARSIIQGTIGTYGQTGLFDHQPSVDLIRKIMGDQFVEDELAMLNSFNHFLVINSTTENLFLTNWKYKVLIG